MARTAQPGENGIPPRPYLYVGLDSCGCALDPLRWIHNVIAISLYDMYHGGGNASRPQRYKKQVDSSFADVGGVLIRGRGSPGWHIAVAGAPRMHPWGGYQGFGFQATNRGQDLIRYSRKLMVEMDWAWSTHVSDKRGSERMHPCGSMKRAIGDSDCPNNLK